MKKFKKIIIGLALGLTLISCTPALQKIHDKVYPKFDYITDQERWGQRDHRSTREERWENGRLKGDCDDFAQEVCDRVDGEFVELWRNEGDVINGYEYKGHAVCISDGYVSDNMSKWVYPESELYKKWNKYTPTDLLQN